MHDGKKLPPGWVKCESSKYPGAFYFFDTQTGKSLWFPPENEGAGQQLAGRLRGEEGTSPSRSAKRPRPGSRIDAYGSGAVKVCAKYVLTE